MGWRWLLVMMIGLSALLAACQKTEETLIEERKITLNDELDAWEVSLRAEANWLWEKRNYLAGHSRPDAEVCAAQPFAHTPAVLTDEQRAEDSVGVDLVAQLDYAAALIQGSRELWERFCELQASAVDTSAVLNSRLNSAFHALNIVRETVDLRLKKNTNTTPAQES